MNKDQVSNVNNSLNFLKVHSSEHDQLIFNVLSCTQNMVEYSLNLNELRKFFNLFDQSMSQLLVKKSFFISHLQQNNFKVCSETDYNDFFLFLQIFPNDSLENLSKRYRFLEQYVEKMSIEEMNSLLFEMKEKEKELKNLVEKSDIFEIENEKLRREINKLAIENEKKVYQLGQLEAQKIETTKELQKIREELKALETKPEKEEKEEEKKNDEEEINYENPFVFDKINLEINYKETQRKLEVRRSEIEAKIPFAKKKDDKKNLEAALKDCKKDIENEKDSFGKKLKSFLKDIDDFEEMAKSNKMMVENVQQVQVDVEKKKKDDEKKSSLNLLKEKENLKKGELQKIEEEIRLNYNPINFQQKVGHLQENPYTQKIQHLNKEIDNIKQKKDKILNKLGFHNENLCLSTCKLMKSLLIPLASRIENIKSVMGFFNWLKIYLDEAKFLIEAGMEEEGLKFQILSDF